MKTTIYTLCGRTARRALAALAVPALLLTAAGCAGADSPKESAEPADIDLDVYLTRAGTDNGTAQERLITTLRVYAFNANGYLDTQEYRSNPLGLTGTPITIPMTVLTGSKTFAVIGNEPAALATALGNVKSLAALRALLMNEDFNTPGATLPFAVTQAETITPGHATPIQVGLQRAVAKVEMKIIKDTQNGDVVTFVSARVTNTPDRSRLAEGYPLTAADYTLGNLAAETFGTLLLSTPADTLQITPKYLYEHYTGAGDAVANNATLLTVVLLINGATNTYHIPLRTEDTWGTKLNDVMRNYLYRLRLTVYPMSIRIDYTIAPWDDETPWAKVAGEDDSNLQFTEWNDEPAYGYVLPV